MKHMFLANLWVDNKIDKAFIHRTQDLAKQQGLAIDDVAHDFRALSVGSLLQLLARNTFRGRDPRGSKQLDFQSRSQEDLACGRAFPDSNKHRSDLRWKKKIKPAMPPLAN